MTERWKPSVTVAAIIERDGRFLLVEERTVEGLKLNNPAGHLDPGESLQQAVVRETLEETTRQFSPDRLVGVYLYRFRRPAADEDMTYLRFAFGGTIGDPDPARTLDTSGGRWVKRIAMTACAVDAVNGGAPAHISKSTQPKL